MEKKTRFGIAALSASALLIGGGLAFGLAAQADTGTPTNPAVAVSSPTVEAPDSGTTGVDTDNVQDESGAADIGTQDGPNVEDGVPDVAGAVTEAN